MEKEKGKKGRKTGRGRWRKRGGIKEERQEGEERKKDKKEGEERQGGEDGKEGKTECGAEVQKLGWTLLL
ncbi:hypothetical protein Pmani_020229 [Petrolisthes manimaculis]|uniref:Uncharacterized protein n=1 Tax=Petrolisthes manimaculis TaxID=1843537 RepID=A0AAE1U6T3_9EUCA|nr:hypothetical protein Pmani_020229 [Petrolisthes manimaculis]